MKSNPVKVSGKLFRYDFDRSVVEYIIKADAETIDAEIEWEQKHGSQLYGVGADGYIVLASAGLRKENWMNTATRKEYLSGWAYELEEEATCLANDFVKYELSNMMKEAAK